MFRTVGSKKYIFSDGPSITFRIETQIVRGYRKHMSTAAAFGRELSNCQHLTMVSPAEKGFHAADYVIFAVTLLVSLGIGLYHAFTGGRQKTTKEFLMGNRNLRTLPVAMSILVSFISAILVLGTPAEMYTRGTQLAMRTFGYCLTCVLSSVLLVPLFFSLNITSSFEVSKQG